MNVVSHPIIRVEEQRSHCVLWLVVLAACLLPVRPAAAQSCDPGPPLEPLLTQPGAIATAELDGRPGADVVVTSTDPIVRVGLNRGDGRFDFTTYVVDPATPDDVVAADFDGLPGIDLMVGTDESSICLLHGNGDGTFAPKVRVSAGEPARIIATADVDRALGPDLVTVGHGTPLAVVVFRNRGDGHFLTPERYALPDIASGLAIADLDGANGPDLFALVGTGLVFFNNGDGTFAAPVDLGLPIANADPVAVVALDVDGANGPDLAIALTWPPKVSVFRNSGGGVFSTPAEEYGLAHPPQLLSSIELDGAPGPDLAVQGGGYLSLLKNDGTGGFALAPDQALGSASGRLATADFDGVGLDDVALVSLETSCLALLRNQGGSFRTFEFFPINQPLTGAIDLVLADLDGRLGLDLVWSGSEEVGTALDRGDGTFADPVAYPSTFGNTPIAVGDIDRDGRADVIESAFSRQTITVYPGLGNGVLGAPVVYDLAPLYPGALAAADLDGMNGIDVVAADPILDGLLVVRSTAAGTLGPAESYPVGDHPIDVVTGDVDGVGGTDVVVANQISSDVSVLRNRGDGTFNPEERYPLTAEPTEVALVDLDRINGPDLVVGSRLGGFTVRLNNGDGTFGPGTVTVTEAEHIAGGDVDGDQLPDLVTNSRLTGIVLHRGRGDGTFLPPEYFGTWYDVAQVAIADVDRQGAAEIVVNSYTGIATHYGCGPRAGACDPGALPAVAALRAAKDAAAGDVVLRWDATGAAGDGYAVWWTSQKTTVPACSTCPGSTAVAGCQPTGSPLVTLCRDLGALAAPPLEPRFYEVRVVCRGVESPI